MDIAKIRKKALSKEVGKEPGEKPVTAPAEGDKRDTEEGPAGGVELSASREEMPPEETAEKDAFRAGVLGDEDVTEEHAEEMIELLTFSLSREEYAFRVPQVEEILRFQKISTVPTMPDYMLGITSLRGKIIPVIDLKTRLNLQEKSSDINPGDGQDTEQKDREAKKILIIDGPKGLIGALIDKVMGVVRLPRSEVLQPPGHLDENELKFIEGIVVLKKRFISIIHSDAAMDIQAS